MKRLRTLSIARPDELDRRNVRISWGRAYWRGVNLRKHRERQWNYTRRLREALGRLYIQPEVSFSQQADGESAVETAARMVH